MQHIIYAIGQYCPYGRLEYVKIGVSTVDGIASRLKSLQTGNPHKLDICSMVIPHYTENIFQLEKKIHARLKSLRMNGEWFKAEGPAYFYATGGLNTIGKVLNG